MSKKQFNNNSFFPLSEPIYTDTGATLLEMATLQALTGLCSHPEALTGFNDTPAVIAKTAVEIGLATLKELEKYRLGYRPK